MMSVIKADGHRVKYTHAHASALLHAAVHGASAHCCISVLCTLQQCALQCDVHNSVCALATVLSCTRVY
jgi:hypothetical protein